MIEDLEEDALLIDAALWQGGYTPTCWHVDTGAASTYAFAEGTWDVVATDAVLTHFGTLPAFDLSPRGGREQKEHCFH